MKKIITVYESFEDQKRAEDLYSLSLSPAERIASVVALIRRIYDPILLKGGRVKKITFVER